nr:hypothetical protein [Aneurinibacillus sp. XH2]
MLNIKSYGMLKKQYEEFKVVKDAWDAEARQAESKKHEVAGEVAAAQAELDELLDREIAGEDLAGEIAQAKSRVTVAEAKKSRIDAKLQAAVPHVKPKFGFITVESEIRNQIGDGRILETFQPDLDEINAIREQYREKVKAVLIRMHEVNKELAAAYRSAARMEGEMTGKSVNVRQAPQLAESDFKPWMWLDSDLATDMAYIRIAVDPKPVLPPVHSGTNADASQAGMYETGMTPQEWVKFNQNIVR